MNRPLFKKSIAELEDAFAQGQSNPDFLKTLLEELENRSTKRAENLKQDILNMMPEEANTNKQTDKNEKEDKPVEPLKFETPQIPRQEAPEIQNSPEDILSAWSALEVLSPPTFDKPEKIAAGDKRAIADISRETMPWENGGERSRPNKKLYYHIVLGSIDMKKSVTDLMQIYADKRAERPPAKGEAILASITVDKEGRPVHDPIASIASYGWGVSRALKGGLKDLGSWNPAEKLLAKGLQDILDIADEEGNIAPLTRSKINQAYEWLIQSLELPDHLIKDPCFAVRKYEYFKNSEPPDSLVLNSFYLNDLALVREKFKNGTATPNLIPILFQRVSIIHGKAVIERTFFGLSA